MKIVVTEVPKKCIDCLFKKEDNETYIAWYSCMLLNEEIPNSDGFYKPKNKLENCPLVSMNDALEDIKKQK